MDNSIALLSVTAVSLGFIHTASRSGSLPAVHSIERSKKVEFKKNNADHISSVASDMF